MNGPRPTRRRTRQPAIVIGRPVSPAPPSPTSPHPIATPHGLSTNTGPLASAAWLAARGLVTSQARWFVEVMLTSVVEPAWMRIELYAEEWGFELVHASKRSWIRVTDVPFVHWHDDHNLLGTVPPLSRLGDFVRDLEGRHGFALDRRTAVVQSSIGGAAVIRSWVETL